MSDKRKAAVFYCRDVPVCSSMNDMIRRLAPQAGIEIVNTAQISIAQPDFTAEVNETLRLAMLGIGVMVMSRMTSIKV
mgnify:CR=1 FL=1